MTPAQAHLAVARVAIADAHADGHWRGRAWGVAACCGVSVAEAEKALARHCQPAPSGRERARLMRLARDAQREAARQVMRGEERELTRWLQGEGVL